MIVTLQTVHNFNIVLDNLKLGHHSVGLEDSSPQMCQYQNLWKWIFEIVDLRFVVLSFDGFRLVEILSCRCFGVGFDELDSR